MDSNNWKTRTRHITISDTKNMATKELKKELEVAGWTSDRAAKNGESLKKIQWPETP